MTRAAGDFTDTGGGNPRGAGLSSGNAALIAFLWACVASPFVLLGYGSVADAWLVARAAASIWENCAYAASRSTGFPLYELLQVLPVRAGRWLLSNMMSILAGLALLSALFRLARRGRFRHAAVTIVTLAFLPIVVTNSSSTMDYIPGLALLLWAYALLLENRRAYSSILLGLAVGFRPSNGLFLIPVLVFLLLDGRRPRDLLIYAAVATTVGAVGFLPALLSVGLNPSLGVMDLGTATRAVIGFYNAAALFGVPGSLAVAAAFLRAFRNRGRSSMRRPLPAFHVTVIALWTLLFIMLPDEPEYLLPAAPSVIFMLDAALPKKFWIAVSVILLSYHFVRIETAGGESGDRRFELSLRPGWTVADAQDRVFKLSVREAAGRAPMDVPTVLMYGALWIPTDNPEWRMDEALGMHKRGDGRLLVSEAIMDEGRLERLRQSGYRLVIWKADKWEYMRGGGFNWRKHVEVIDDLEAFFGSPLKGRPESLR